MALPITTFSNRFGGSVFFKALGHPLAADRGRDIAARLGAAKNAAVYDPLGQFAAFAALYPAAAKCARHFFVRDTLLLDAETLGTPHRPITELKNCGAEILFIPAFDAAVLRSQIGHLLPDGCQTTTLDDMRLPDSLLTNKRNYLHPLNFATNFAFFRDQNELHTRIVTANYWGGYGARDAFLSCILFGGDGEQLAAFDAPLPHPNGTVVIDSREVRRRHRLPDFCGQLFISVINGAGHDIVKYAIDTDGGDDGEFFSCTHDANAWPADVYAGLPAPDAGERVILWVQNSHPTPIAAGEIGLNLMGDDAVARYNEEIPPFASRALGVENLLPDAKWPQQVEIQAGKWFVRPRYEIIKKGRRRINHPNVERVDLRHNEDIRRVSARLGKGFILPAPILPAARFKSECLPTPMSTAQRNMPLSAVFYGADGVCAGRQSLGVVPRRHTCLLDLNNTPLPGGGGGHIELIYDLSMPDGVLDGWLHALFRYTDRRSGHAAETSFGSHLFNHLLTFLDEPQSYKGPPPGLSTRLFLRLLPPPRKTFCFLIYPVCERWKPHSSTRLELKNARGEIIAHHDIQIPACGSRFIWVDEIFSAETLKAAGEDAAVLVRDATCRLFGYHGGRHGGGFALDHMFGF